ncbi:mismatch-specific DNA-glycosylase [Actinomycetes bacterium NPDC127524]
MDRINDHIKHNLLILFVGFNPSLLSGKTGHHYANPRNRFWKILYYSGLTPKIHHFSEDAELLSAGYGFTNIVQRPTKNAGEITKEEYKAGREDLIKKVVYYKPKIVCFVGKGVYKEYSKKPKSQWGIQNDSRVPGTIDFVAPSSSGLVRMKMDEIIEIYSELTALAAKFTG